VQSNGTSDSPTLSGDGRFAVFHSNATNLVAGDTNAFFDIFRKDRSNGVLVRVSVATGGAQSNGSSFVPVVSADGNVIAFTSSATNLVAGDTNNHGDVFVRDVLADTTTRVSVSSSGVQSGNDSESPAISADGRYVVFTSYGSNLVAGDTNGVADVFLRDRQTGTTTRVSIATNNAQGNGWSDMSDISPDGGWVAFASVASNLVAGDTNAATDVFLRDLAGATTVRVSLSSAGVQGDTSSFQPRLSTDARSISFHSLATNLVAGDTNANFDVFVRDRLSSTTQRVSLSSAGAQGNANSLNAWISADGSAIAFESVATNLVAGDTNNKNDMFVRVRACPAAVTYCSAGTTTNGCLASIAASGTPSASAGSGFTLSVAQMEGQKNALLFYGVNGRANAPWGVGGTSYLCVAPPNQRTPAQISSGTAGACNGAIALDWNAYVAANPGALGAPFAAGALVQAQAWFRDPPAPKSTNLSNAIEFVVCP
jgi:Tol biopolymer transport system component